MNPLRYISQLFRAATTRLRKQTRPALPGASAQPEEAISRRKVDRPDYFFPEPDADPQDRPRNRYGRFSDADTQHEPSGAVVGFAKWDRGAFAVGAPVGGLDLKRAWEESPELPPRIISRWNTWNRPFTTLELAALQGLPVLPSDWDGEPFQMEGGHTRQRMHIGNGVPVAAAQAIAEEMAETLLRARLEESFRLSAQPIWVGPRTARNRLWLRVALSVETPSFC